MKLTHLIKESKKEIDIHREYSPGEAFTSLREKGRVFIILHPYTAAQGVKKWTGIEFVLDNKNSYMASADVTTAGDDQAFKGYKKVKLTSKMKKQIQQVLKDPEEVDRIQNSDTKIRDVERAVR
tara:strand:+ start:556 stop:927 length:372 start_codon:yes stop_codon:yes gene_type:complete